MIVVIPADAPTPSPRPTSPPMVDSSTDSTRNWRRMSRWRAPTAMRMPISRVRSVTETSMMFMIPTPPTNREMPAIDAKNAVIVPTMKSSISRISVVLWMSKSGGSPGGIWWRSNNSCRISCSAWAIRFVDRAEARMMSTLSNIEPLIRFLIVVYGANTTLS